MIRPHRAFTALTLLSVSGCCNLANYFCGPDRSQWVKASYATPDSALATFMESLRRDDRSQIYDSLSQGFKRRNGNLGEAEVHILLERWEDEDVAYYMLGGAEVSKPSVLSPDRVGYVLTISGHSVRCELVRQDYWQVTDLRDGRLREFGGYLDGPISDLIAVSFHDEDENVEFVDIRTPSIETLVMRAGDIQSAGVGRDWKVDVLEALPES